MSTAIPEADTSVLTVLISAERLGRLMALTGTAGAAIALHQETLRVGSRLMNVIATLEISLRNAICENLGSHFGTPDWLTDPPPGFTWQKTEKDNIAKAEDSAKRAEYSKLSQAHRRELDALSFPGGKPAGLPHLARAKARRTHIAVTQGKVIAELTFYTWKRLCGPEYEHSLWRPSLKRIFPDKSIRRPEVAEHLETVYQCRNRLAHHEPVVHHRFDQAITSIEFLAGHLMAARGTEGTALARLIAPDLELVQMGAKALHEHLDAYRKT